MKFPLPFTAFFPALACVTLATRVFAGLDPASFQNPPADTRPMTWMHMMNGNLSKEGLARDLQGLADAGVGGALIFSINRSSPLGPVKFNSQEFRDIIVHGAKEADRLGLTIGVHNCDGWSSSGGPWVTDDDAMKRLAWSETVVQGGGKISLQLPRPAVRRGYFHDVAVVAFPATAAELAALENRPTLTGSCGPEEVAKLLDDSLDTRPAFKLSKRGKDQSEKLWLQFAYARPLPARSIHVEHDSRNGKAVLLASDDGQVFRKVVDLAPAFRPGKSVWAFETTFTAVEAKFFRLEFDSAIALISVDLAPFPRLPSWLDQTSVSRGADAEIHRLTPPPAAEFASLEKAIVLAVAPGADGALSADLPAGVWRVMRIGYSLTGAHNHPATDAGRGNECDKLDAAALDRHFAAYVGKLAQECGPLAGRSFLFTEIDSYEMGGQNWTRGLDVTFRKKFGYDLTPFLPLLAGRLVGDPETAAAVLGDFRRLISELMVKNYFGRFTELCHTYQMRSYIEPYGNGGFDGLSAGGVSDIPMGEFWMDRWTHEGIGFATSAAHTYGKPVISAESFTSWRELNWKVHPWLLKGAGDAGWTQGINEFMFHRFAHQANPHVAPGMTMDSVGSHLDRTQTWWLNAGKAWMQYLQRGQHLLRQGVPVADLLVYVGEGSPHDLLSAKEAGLPAGYNLDNCDTEVLMNRLVVRDGRLVLPEGTSYRALLLANCERMSLPVLRRVEALLKAGATIIAPKPYSPLGYFEQKNSRSDFTTLIDQLWADSRSPRKIGSGLLIPSAKWSTAKIFLAPDFTVREVPDALFTHRQIGGAHVYFFHNREKIARTFHASFRVTGLIPELWHADTGTIETLAHFTQTNDRTEIPIALDAMGSAFVVFRQPSKKFDPVATFAGPDTAARLNFTSDGALQLSTATAGDYTITRASGVIQTITVPALPAPLPVVGPWRVAFDGPGLKDPRELSFPTLTDWKDHAREDIRHFSGTAVYRMPLEVPASTLGAGRRLLLDLGRVEIAAEVFVNGTALGTLWKPPFVIDVTAQLRAGANQLEVRVTNLWTNRLIGDEAHERTDGYDPDGKMPAWYSENRPLPPGSRSTFTTFNFYDTDRTLQPSGLLGPVQLKSVARASPP